MDEFQLSWSPPIQAEFLYDDDLIYHQHERIPQSEELSIQHPPEELVIHQPSHAIQVIDQPPQEVIHYPTEVVQQNGQFVHQPGRVMHYPLQEIIQENPTGEGAYEQPFYLHGTRFIDQAPQEVIHNPTEVIQQPGHVMHHPLQETIQENPTGEGAYEQPPYLLVTGFIDQAPQEVIHYPTEVIQQPGQVMHHPLQETIQENPTGEGAYEQPPYLHVTGFIDQAPQEVIHYPTEVIQQPGQVMHHPLQETIQENPTGEGAYEQPPYLHVTGFIDQAPQEVIHYPTEVIQQPGQVMHHPLQETIQEHPTGEGVYEQPPYPPGVRFAPTDVELLMHYLIKKIQGEPIPGKIVNAEDVYMSHPEDIVEAHKGSGENAWYFFTPRDRRYGRGKRPRRSAGPGYWKASGSDKEVYDKNGVQIGSKRHLVYFVGKQPGGVKTNWMMYEYKMQDSHIPLDPNPNVKIMRLDTWVLCKIYKKAEKTD